MKFSLGAIPDQLDTRDRSYRDRITAATTASLLPASVDNRTQCSPVRHQGEEPSCVGHAVAGAAEFYYWKKLGQLPGFSPRAAYNWARQCDSIPGEWHDGSTIRGGLKAWQKRGMCPWPCWPYVAQHSGAPCENADKLSAQYPLWRYERLDGLVEVKHAIHQYGAVCATVMVHSGWEAPEEQRGFVIQPSMNEEGWHAIVLCGYNDNLGFVVRNSWGSDWADGGYAWLPYEDFARNHHDAWLPLLRQSWMGPIVEWFRRVYSGLSRNA